MVGKLAIFWIFVVWSCTSHQINGKMLTPTTEKTAAVPSEPTSGPITKQIPEEILNPGSNKTQPKRSDTIVATLNKLTQLVCLFVIICGVAGNLLVLGIFCYRCSALKSFETLMVNLAVADLLGTLVLPSIHFHQISGGSFHTIGVQGCKAIYFYLGITFV